MWEPIRLLKTRANQEGRKNLNRKQLASLILIAAITLALATAVMIRISTLNSSYTIYPSAPSFTVWSGNSSGILLFYAKDAYGIQPAWSGSTNATYVINNVLGSVSGTEENLVVLKGNFKIDTTDFINIQKNYTTVELFGKIEFTAGPAVASKIIYANNLNNIKWIGGDIDGNNLTGINSYGIYFDRVTDGRIENCYVHDINGSWSYGIYVSACTRLVSASCKVEECASAGIEYAYGTVDSDMVDCVGINNAHVEGSSAHFELFGSPDHYVQRCNIIDCKGSGNSHPLSAEIAEYCTDCFIFGGNYVVEAAGSSGIGVNGDPTGPRTCEGCGVIGATVRSLDRTVPDRIGIISYGAGAIIKGCTVTDFYTGIYLTSDSLAVNAEGNIIRGCGDGCGFEIEGGTACLVTDNTFYANTAIAISVRTGSTLNLFSGNVVYSGWDGFVLYSGSANNTIIGNVVRVQNTPFFDAGTNNLDINNTKVTY
jgi:parallel beta-helix repeat protein